MPYFVQRLVSKFRRNFFQEKSFPNLGEKANFARFVSARLVKKYCNKTYYIHLLSFLRQIFPQVRKTFFLKKVSSKLRYQPLHKIRHFVDSGCFLQKIGRAFPLNLNDFFLRKCYQRFFLDKTVFWD